MKRNIEKYRQRKQAYNALAKKNSSTSGARINTAAHHLIVAHHQYRVSRSGSARGGVAHHQRHQNNIAQRARNNKRASAA